MHRASLLKILIASKRNLGEMWADLKFLLRGKNDSYKVYSIGLGCVRMVPINRDQEEAE